MYNDPRSHGLWEKTAPIAPPTAELNENITSDVVIVGGGFTGMSAALHLAERGIKTCVLEAKQIGYGGAGRNVGLINGGMWVMPKELPSVLGNKFGERVLDLLGGAPLLVRELVQKHNIQCDIETNGTLHLAVGDSGLKELQERYDQWSTRGAPVRLLDTEETSKRVGSTAYAGALIDSRAGTIQPLAYVRGLAQAAINAGSLIYTESPAIETIRAGSNWTVKTNKGSVTAKWIIVASEAYSTGPWEIVRNEQLYLPYFNFATKPLNADQLKTVLPGREGCWDTKEILSSFRMDRNGRLVFGSVGALRNTGAAIHKAWAIRSIKRIFPQLANVEFECEWYGKIGMTDNSVPRFHKFADNVVGFSGYNGRGIAPGSIFGKTIAAHVAGELSEDDLPLPLTEAKAQSFRNTREAYYELGAQIAHLAGERF